MLKKLFYASASILMLALGALVGSEVARSQASATILGANVATITGYATGVVGRTFYFKRTNSSEPAGTVPDPVPGASAVIATGGLPSSNLLAVLDNGDVWSRNLSDAGWVYFGNLIGGPTPAAQPTWGQLKVQYRK